MRVKETISDMGDLVEEITTKYKDEHQRRKRKRRWKELLTVLFLVVAVCLLVGRGVYVFFFREADGDEIQEAANLPTEIPKVEAKRFRTNDRELASARDFTERVLTLLAADNKDSVKVLYSKSAPARMRELSVNRLGLLKDPGKVTVTDVSRKKEGDTDYFRVVLNDTDGRIYPMYLVKGAKERFLIYNF